MKILVLYYTQTGQLKEILDQVVKNIKDEAEIDFQEIKAATPFPFPWTSDTFFDAMPECVLQIPAGVVPMPQLREKEYDLVIYGYQPWFLSQSNPSNSFLKSEWASVLKGKPVVTVVGCRNMWLHAQETVKQALGEIGAQHVGSIVLEDKHPNLTSLFTILRWLFKGQKEASGRLPAAGVSDNDIHRAERFGRPIFNHIAERKLEALQPALLNLGAIELRPNLIVLERRGNGQFPKWAKRARAKGGPGDPARKPVLKTFKRLLMLGIFVLSPVSALTAKIAIALSRRKFMQEVDYFKSVAYVPGKIRKVQ